MEAILTASQSHHSTTSTTWSKQYTGGPSPYDRGTPGNNPEDALTYIFSCKLTCSNMTFEVFTHAIHQQTQHFQSIQGHLQHKIISNIINLLSTINDN